MKNQFFNRLMMAAAILGVLGVITGAFGAHFLKSRLDANDLETIKTGVLYLFIHVLATLIISGIAGTGTHTTWLKTAGISFLLGVLLFSGSLFIIGTASLTGFSVSTIGFLTPIGGLFFIAGWIAILVNGIVRRPIH